LYLGPFTIVRINPSGSYTLRSFDGSYFPRDVTRDVLKPINSDFLKPVEDELNRRFYVTDIKSHRTAADGSLELLVSWANGDDDSWISIDLVDNHGILRDYITTSRRRQPGDALPASADLGFFLPPNQDAPPTQRKPRRKPNMRQTAPPIVAVSPAVAPAAVTEPAVPGKRQRRPNSTLRDSVTY